VEGSFASKKGSVVQLILTSFFTLRKQ
jgi:hypothetical protein